MSTRRTPRKSRRSGASSNGVGAQGTGTGPSPARVTRLEEKQQLAELNKRLEHYILRQREKDANQGVLEKELEAFREQADAELEQAQTLWNDQLTKTRQERDEHSSRCAQLESDLDRLRRQLGEARMEADKANNDNERLRDQAQDLTRSKADLELQLLHAREEASTLGTQLEMERSKRESLQHLLDEEREQGEESERRAVVAESKVRGLQEDLVLARTQNTEELNRLREQAKDLTHKNAHVEEETRREFTEQLQELLDTRQNQWEEDHDGALQTLKDQFEEKLTAYRDHLERAGHELEELRSQLGDREAKEAELQSQTEEAVSGKVLLQKRIKDLEEELEEEKDRPNKRISELLEIIRRLKASFKRKEKEFEDLMDVKIALLMEIQQYRQLLEREEQRLGYTSPSAKRRKRKRGDRGVSDPVDQQDRKHDLDDGTLLISGVEFDGSSLIIRNVSASEQSTAGWSLQSVQNGQVFNLPRMDLPPGSSVRIIIGAGAAQAGDDDVVWDEEEDIFHAGGDQVVLVDPQGDVVSERSILPEHDTTEPGAGGAGGGAGAGASLKRPRYDEGKGGAMDEDEDEYDDDGEEGKQECAVM